MTRPIALLLLLAPAARAQDAPPDVPEPLEDPAPGRAEEAREPVLTLSAAFGAGPVGERETGWGPSLGLRAGVAVGLPAHVRLVATYAEAFHDQVYLSTAPGPDGTGTHRVEVAEQTIAAGLGADVDVARYVPSAPERLHLRPGLAPWVVFLDDAAFSTWLVAMRLSLDVEVPLAKGLSLVGGGAFAPGMSRSPETLSALGLPQHAWDARVGLSETFGAFAVTGAWSVDGLVFEHTLRVRHLAMVGLSYSL